MSRLGVSNVKGKELSIILQSWIPILFPSSPLGFSCFLPLLGWTFSFPETLMLVFKKGCLRNTRELQ